MKRTILFSIIMMVSFYVHAQLEVDSTGKVYTAGKLNVTGGINIQNLSGNQNLRLYKSHYAGSSRNYNIIAESHSKSSYNYNIYALISDTLASDSNNKFYGLYSSVTGTRSPYSYGVFGKVGWKGIGVFGTNGNSLPSISQSYAGYFSGPTHVQGDLTVSGNISGVLLNSPANASPNSSSTNAMPFPERAALPNKLHNLTAHTFYIDAPQRTSHAEEAAQTPSTTLTEDEDVPEDDMVVGLPEPTAIERQIYAKQHYGLDANQLEEVFPDLVYENEDGTKSINYVEMVPILVQAINELKSELDELKGNGAAKKGQTRAASADEMGDNLVMLSLGQNKPNPFGTTTSIEVSIPNEVQKAFIYVYDLQGKKVDQVDITARGKQTVLLNAAALTDGMYLYSLIADGKVVETRRMIVEK